MIRERRAQTLEIAGAQSHRPAPRDAIGRVREADEPLALARLEQLHERRESLATRLLRQS